MPASTKCLASLCNPLNMVKRLRVSEQLIDFMSIFVSEGDFILIISP